MNAKFDEKMKRIDDAIAMKEPDRVPVIPFAQTYVMTHAGHTMAEAMYHPEAAQDSVRKYLQEYDPDGSYGYGAFMCGMGPAFEASGMTMMQWAGQPGGICKENSIHQFVEKTYLGDEEYPELFRDLSGWIMKKYLPRNFSVLKPLANLDFSTLMGFGCFAGLMQFANPQIVEMFEQMADAGRKALHSYSEVARFDQEMIEAGYPLLFNATVTTAFDMLSDTLRGTIATMEDLYEQPENVLQACELFYPASFYGAMAQAQQSPGKMVFIPLHKGLDGFMGTEQYAQFYWPTLKRLTEDLIKAGQIPYLYTEGKYDSRLEFLKELPEGKCVVHFENVDMKRAKELVGDHVCITGGFDEKILNTAKPEEVRDSVKRLLDICAPGGGYMFDINMTLDEGAKPENVEAMFDEVKTYGRY